MGEEGAELLRRAEEEPQDIDEILEEIDGLSSEVEWDLQRMLNGEE